MPENISKDNISEVRTTLGQYFLQKKIAQGGMAEIFKGIASDIHGMKRTVCIKKILPHIAANKEFVDMLVSEAKIAVQLNHGNIAQIYDLGRAGNDYFMVMEYVDGKSLSQIHKRCLKEGELIPLKYVIYLISEVANGLDYMHRKKDEAGNPLEIVHRDISPQNIIVSFSGTVKIIDFGIAKAAFNVDDTESGVLKGKFAYMSPEQARGESIDGKSDIFSLGVILHELVSGRRLFKDKDNKATIRNVRRTDVRPPSVYNPSAPKELDAIVMKALAKETKKRYQHASEMRDDLIKLLYSRFPDFKPTSVIDFILDLFGSDIDRDEDDDEKEHTPLLIVDQTQPAINIAAPHVMKEFMLEEPEPEKEEKEPLEDIEEAPEKERPSMVQKMKDLWVKARPSLIRYSIILAALVMAVFIFHAGKRYGWWKMWSDFFRAEMVTRGVVKKLAVQKHMTLIIDSKPSGAQIYIDDVQTRNVTPTTIADFKADGKAHKVGLFLDKYNYMTIPFTATPDETIRIEPRLDMSYGELMVISNPEGANVLLDGNIVGQTPFKKDNVEPGTVYKVAVAKEGFTPFGDDIRISPNKASVLRVSLMRLPTRPGEMQVPIPKLSEPEQQALQAPGAKGPPKATEKTFMLPDTSGAKATFTLTEIPLLPAQPIEPPPQPVSPPPASKAEETQPAAVPEENAPKPQETAPTIEQESQPEAISLQQQPPEQPVEEPQQQPLVPQIMPPSSPGAPTPDSRGQKFELDY